MGLFITDLSVDLVTDGVSDYIFIVSSLWTHLSFTQENFVFLHFGWSSFSIWRMTRNSFHFRVEHGYSPLSPWEFLYKVYWLKFLVSVRQVYVKVFFPLCCVNGSYVCMSVKVSSVLDVNDFNPTQCTPRKVCYELRKVFYYVLRCVKDWVYRRSFIYHIASSLLESFRNCHLEGFGSHKVFILEILKRLRLSPYTKENFLSYSDGFEIDKTPLSSFPSK